jgi:DNA-binding MarR family transcriptional regulator
MIDPLSDLPGYVLRRASAAMLQDLGRRLQPLGLTPTEASILLLIGSNPGMTQSDIGRNLDIQRANMTPMTARLEKRGLILRAYVNGRSQGLSLSPDGNNLIERVRAAVRAHEDHLISHVRAEDRQTVLAALKALWQASGN